MVALIYNSSQSDKAVAVIAFGGDKTVSSGTFTIQFPTADASNAIIQYSVGGRPMSTDFRMGQVHLGPS